MDDDRPTMAICPNCSGLAVVDPEFDQYVCQDCGEVFIGDEDDGQGRP